MLTILTTDQTAFVREVLNTPQLPTDSSLHLPLYAYAQLRRVGLNIDECQAVALLAINDAIRSQPSSGGGD